MHALRRLSSHCCVVGLHDAFESTDSRKLHIVAEFCESGSLETRLNSARRSVERNGWGVWQDLRAHRPELDVPAVRGALEHLHKHHTLHRDLKPANIFLCNGGRLVKLGDFGLVNVLESSLGRGQVECRYAVLQSDARAAAHGVGKARPRICGRWASA